ncbi:hypothetical protein C8F04DRAFT_1182511 [Mycena alexandri]|uniref:Uncharacterized protein n=1 Tax=Mycena alexandri TaxID=1745969 RepID=A0AAD6SWZ5_9AGAR|nr:hypothetical protein C8F04DRAFT_1182511 [Mycena alexandri]
MTSADPFAPCVCSQWANEYPDKLLWSLSFQILEKGFQDVHEICALRHALQFTGVLRGNASPRSRSMVYKQEAGSPTTPARCEGPKVVHDLHVGMWAARSARGLVGGARSLWGSVEVVRSVRGGRGLVAQGDPHRDSKTFRGQGSRGGKIRPRLRLTGCRLPVGTCGIGKSVGEQDRGIRHWHANIWCQENGGRANGRGIHSMEQEPILRGIRTLRKFIGQFLKENAEGDTLCNESGRLEWEGFNCLVKRVRIERVESTRLSHGWKRKEELLETLEAEIRSVFGLVKQ